jgi:AcrR family transcriptional regulator
MHFVTNSATTSRAAQRRLETASRLTAVCRRLTAESGLAGFTIEEACEEVGVSRRTFFNYFPSKEEAVLGVDEVEEMRALGAEFQARGSRGWQMVVDDLIELISEYVHAAGLDAAEHIELHRAVEREPRLLARFIGVSREREAELAGLIAVRENVAPDDPHVRACVAVLIATLRLTGDRLIDYGVADNFGSSLNDSLATIRDVLDIPTTRKARL